MHKEWLALLSLLLIAVVLVYYPGLSGPYVLDDGENLLANEAIAIRDLRPATLYNAAISSGEPLLRPLASLTFALNYYMAGGFEPSFSFKLTNVLIHLLNTILLFFLVRSMVRAPALASISSINRDRFAILAAAMWGLHPIQLTSVLYIAQRMNSLAAFFVLAGLLVFVHGRLALADKRRRGLAAMAGGMMLGLIGVTAKENAALIPLLAISMEYTLFRQSGLPAATQKKSNIVYSFAIGIPAFVILAYLLYHPQLITGTYIERDFTLVERVLTQARVLWYYISLLLVPSIERLALFHDDIVISRGLLSPLTTLPALIGIALIAGFALARAGRYPILAFSVLWFLAGHVLESSIIGLEMVYEHRNYLPSIGPIIGIAAGLIRLVDQTKSAPKKLWLFMPLIAIVLALATWRLSTIWADIDSLADHTVQHHPDSARAMEFAASAKIADGDYAQGMRYLRRGRLLAFNDVSFAINTELLLVKVATDVNEKISQRPHERENILRAYQKRLAPEISVVRQNNKIALQVASDHRERIVTLLGTKPLTARGMLALHNLAPCLPLPSCHDTANQAKKWFAIAGDNPQIRPVYRAEILAMSAELHAASGEFEQALTQAQRAAVLDQKRPFYQLLVAEYLLGNRRRDEAAALLDTLNHTSSRQLQPGGQHYRYFQQLLQSTLAKDKG